MRVISKLNDGRQRPLNTGNLLYIYDDGKDEQIVSGIIIPVAVGQRGNTPKPINGGITGGTTGYENGHIFALFLGGTDDRLNIVPQTAGWQGYGAWNQMEKDLKFIAASIEPKLVRLTIWINQWTGTGANTGKIPVRYIGRITILESDGATKVNEYWFDIRQPVAPAQSSAVWRTKFNAGSVTNPRAIITQSNRPVRTESPRPKKKRRFSVYDKFILFHL